MPLYILDSDTVTHLRNRHPVVLDRARRVPEADVCVSVITLEEQLDGWYKLLHRPIPKPRLADAYRRLVETVGHYRFARILPFTEEAIDHAERLLKMRLNVKRNDLRIAAIALEADATVVTANVRDFTRVPGLLVEDWTQPVA